MPYIKMEARERFKNVIDALLDSPTKSVGELNYLLTCVCQMYLVSHKETYQAHNDVVGALECVKQEWYRRQTVDYENRKIEENGDVHIRIEPPKLG